jgi:hypothetical protein
VFRALKKALRDLFDYDYRPSILIADGAEAITNGFMEAFDYESADDFTRIMCWAHLYRLLQTSTSKLPHGAELFQDIQDWQCSHSPELFERNTVLFFQKVEWKKNRGD